MNSMRSRVKIEEDMKSQEGNLAMRAVNFLMFTILLEVCLDIRDLLSSKNK